MRSMRLFVVLLSVSVTANAYAGPVAASKAAPAAAGPAVPSLGRLLNAIREVETGNHPDPANALGDGGRSLGPYQITWKYWKDSGIPGRYDQVRNRAYAERVIVAYWQRFCPDALAKGDWRTLAKVHNGGPNGAAVPKTIAYWLKVRRILVH